METEGGGKGHNHTDANRNKESQKHTERADILTQMGDRYKVVAEEVGEKPFGMGKTRRHSRSRVFESLVMTLF